MNKFIDTKALIPGRVDALLFIALVIAGLAGNYFSYEIIFNLQFIFGSIFAMLALQTLGFAPGILAAALISSMTYYLFNHPYAIITMTCEVIAVGWLFRRKKIGLVLADVIYWICVGMPLVYIFYNGVMHLSSANVFIIMIKQAINGIANALFARLIFTVFALRSRSSLISYREIVYNLLAFFVLIPALIMLAVGSKSDFNETDRHIRTSLIENSQRLEQSLEAWVKNRKSAVLYLAEIAASRSPLQMQSCLEQAKKSDVNFLRIGLLNKEATITAYFPLLDELGQSSIGKNFADRPYIPKLRQTLKPILSEVVIGKVGIPKPIVMIIAPVVIRGEYGGYIAGTLGLDQIKASLDNSISENTALYTLLDKNGNVIMTNRTDQKMMKPFVRGKGTLNRLDKRTSQWVPTLPPNTSITGRWKNSSYVAEAAIGDLTEWKLILEQPVAPFQKTLYDNYTGKLILLFLILLVALALAELLSRKVMVSIEKLREISFDLPGKISSGESVLWPESNIMETRHLLANFKNMANALSDKIREIQRIAEIEREQYFKFFQTSTDMMCMADPNGAFIKTNPAFSETLGYSEAEFVSKPFIEFVHPEDKQSTLDEMARQLQSGFTLNFENRYICKDGSLRWLSWRANYNKDEGITYAIARDVTDNKLTEKVLKESEDRFRSIFTQAFDGILIADVDGKSFVEANQAICTMLGYDRDELLGLGVRNIHPESCLPLAVSAFEKIVRGEISLAENTPMLRKDGSVFYADISATTISLSGKLCLVGMFRDITERKRAEEQISRSLKEKTVMLQEIHHRVKNNMQVICSLINLQAKNITDKEIRAKFEESRNRVLSMSLIHEKLYRSEDLAHVDFKEYLKSLVGDIADTYKRYDVVLSVDMESVALDVNIGIPCGLIVNELVSNSLKYAFPEGREGTISVGISINNEGNYVLFVHDNGIGFPAGIDFRHMSSLGLQLVNALTHQIHGRIELSTEEGARLRITFPRQQRSGDQNEL